MSEGVLFGDYLLLGRLAAGGMAEVYLARALHDPQPNHLLAIKRMLPRLSEDPTFVDMFNDEARIAKGLTHPNICRIVDQGQHDGQLFIVMEFVHGKDLRVLKKRAQKRNEPIPARIAAFVLAKIAEALDYAHRKTNDAGQPEHIIHRDVSPQNILLSYDGVPKLIDFGIAKAKDRLVQTRVGIVKGKFAYMSPEQATGQALDARSDVFALGIVLYELLTGDLPFKGENDLSTLKRIAKGDFAAPTTRNRDLPPRLGAVVERALQREPANRYPSAGEMAADLYRHLADERRELSEALLSSYVRRLFRDDYIREMGRIRDFLALRAPAARPTPAAGAASAGAARPEPTTVTPSSFLAAGYEGPPSSPEAQPVPADALATRADAAPTSAEGLQIDAADVDGALFTLAEIDTLDVPADTFDRSATAGDEPTTAGATAEGLWDDGPDTDKLRRPTLDTKPEPLIPGADAPALVPPPGASPEPAAQATSVTAPDTPLPFDVPNTLPPDAPDPDDDAFDVAPTTAFSEAELKAMVASGAQRPADEPSTRELSDGEVGAIMAEAAKLAPPVDDPFADQSSIELDSAAVQIDEPRSEGTDFDIQIDEAPPSGSPPRKPRGGAAPERAAPTRPPAAPLAPVPLTPAPPAGRLLTGNEMAALLLAAMLGLASVAGAYWMASRGPLPEPPEQHAPVGP